MPQLTITLDALDIRILVREKLQQEYGRSVDKIDIIIHNATESNGPSFKCVVAQLGDKVDLQPVIDVKSTNGVLYK